MRNVLIVYHYIAHYRLPIFNLLSKSEKPSYTILSGIKTDINIKTANIEFSEISPKNGGVKWIIVKNYWFLKYFLNRISHRQQRLIGIVTMLFDNWHYYSQGQSIGLGQSCPSSPTKKQILQCHGALSCFKTTNDFWAVEKYMLKVNFITNYNLYFSFVVYVLNLFYEIIV